MASSLLLENYFFNPFSFPPLLVGVLAYFFGLYVFCQSKKSLTHFTFLIVCLSAGTWLVGTALVYASRTAGNALFWYRWLAFLGVVNIAPSIYFFSTSWLESFRRQKTVVYVGYLIFFVFYLLGLSTGWMIQSSVKHFWGFYPRYGPLAAPYLILFFIYWAGAYYNLIRGWRLARDAMRKKQILFISIAFLLSSNASFDYLSKLFDVSFYPFGYLAVLCWIIVVAYAILKYQLLDIRTIIHKTIMWLITSSLFWAPMIFFFYVARDWLVSLHPLAFLFVISFVFMLFALYGRHIQPRIDHLFQRRHWDLMRALEKFTDELVHLRDLDEVVTHTLTTVQRLFYVPNVFLLIRKEDADDFAVVRKEAFEKKFSYSMRNTFLKWLELNDVIVVEEYLSVDPRFEKIATSGRDYFEDFHANLCVPLIVNKKLIGILNIGQKQNLQPFRASEIAFLSDLRRSAAIALSNSLRLIAMQESLRRWNVELEKKVDERTRELKDTQAQLVQAEKLATIGTLAGGIAHEINNPLTAVLTNAQILKMDAEPDTLESISLIEEGAKRCQSIIQKLMKYARKSAEAEVREKVNMNKVVANAVAFLEYQLRQDNIQLVTDGESAIEPIEGNANELEQVVTNLVLNAKDAIKQTDHEGKIIVRTFEENGAVGLAVSDNGIGVLKENLAKIFDPFFTTKEVGKGTGLGLAVTYGIIQKHKGTIDVASEYGKGATFTVTLPKGVIPSKVPGT